MNLLEKLSKIKEFNTKYNINDPSIDTYDYTQISSVYNLLFNSMNTSDHIGILYKGLINEFKKKNMKKALVHYCSICPFGIELAIERAMIISEKMNEYDKVIETLKKAVDNGNILAKSKLQLIFNKQLVMEYEKSKQYNISVDYCKKIVKETNDPYMLYFLANLRKKYNDKYLLEIPYNELDSLGYVDSLYYYALERDDILYENGLEVERKYHFFISAAKKSKLALDYLIKKFGQMNYNRLDLLIILHERSEWQKEYLKIVEQLKHSEYEELFCRNITLENRLKTMCEIDTECVKYNQIRGPYAKDFYDICKFLNIYSNDERQEYVDHIFTKLNEHCDIIGESKNKIRIGDRVPGELCVDYLYDENNTKIDFDVCHLDIRIPRIGFIMKYYYNKDKNYKRELSKDIDIVVIKRSNEDVGILFQSLALIFKRKCGDKYFSEISTIFSEKAAKCNQKDAIYDSALRSLGNNKQRGIELLKLAISLGCYDAYFDLGNVVSKNEEKFKYLNDGALLGERRCIKEIVFKYLDHVDEFDIDIDNIIKKFNETFSSFDDDWTVREKINKYYKNLECDSNISIIKKKLDMLK